MILQNNNNCVFYNKYFLDDLYPYNIIDKEENLEIEYIKDNDQKQTHPIELKVDSLLELISYSIPSDELYKQDVWYPVFVNLENSLTPNKMLLGGSPVKHNNLGIENIIKFQPELQSWNISSDISLSTDWIINGLIIPYDLEYGILCWFKNSKKSNDKSEISVDTEFTFDKLCLGVNYKPNQVLTYKNADNQDVQVTTESIVSKKTNDILEIINIAETLFDTESEAIKYNTNIRYFSINEYLDFTVIRNTSETDQEYIDRRQSVFDTITFKVINSDNLIDTNSPDLKLWVSNGDSFSYFKGTEDKKEATNTQRASWTYLSPNLFHIYREIYHILTIKHKKYINKPFLNRKQTRLLKKLAYFLSTGPLLDRTTINCLSRSSVQDIVEEYLDKSIASIDEEINILKEVIAKIMLELKDFSNVSNSSYYYNIINNKKELCRKLISKYGSYLQIDTETTLTFKDQLKYGPHFRLNQDIFSKCNKNLSDTIVFNNIEINAGSYRAQSLITDSTSSFIVKDTRTSTNTTIPLWDIEKKKILKDEIKISAGDDQIIKFYNEDKDGNIQIPNEKLFTLKNSLVPDYDFEPVKGDQLIVKWEKLSGSDCLRFSDDNLDRITGTFNDIDLRYETSSDISPTIYVKKPGRYVIQVTVRASFGLVRDSVIIYVIDQNGFYEGNKKPPALNTASYEILKPTNNLIAICPNLREFAISKFGIFWPTYSDAKVYSRDSNPFGKISSFGDQIKKYKFDTFYANDSTVLSMPYDRSPINLPVPLSITYKPNNTKITVSRIILSNMLDDNINCYYCESFFKNLSTSDGFSAELNHEFSLINDKDAPIVFKQPTEVKTNSYIHSYGGYDNKIIDSIGVNIPYHPKDKELPQITGGLDIYPMSYPVDSGGKPYHACYLQDINLSGSIIFDKGVFHPFSGWYMNPGVTGFYKEYKTSKNTYNNIKNKSSVIKFDPGSRKTLTFKGQGFYRLINEYTEDDPSPKFFRSDITLYTTETAHECRSASPEGCTIEETIGNEKKEIDDHDINFGYRNTGTNFDKQAVYSDEFVANISYVSEGGATTQDYCIDNKEVYTAIYSNEYGITRKGSYVPDDERSETTRFTRSLSGASIKDIEVELGFLNYVNTKDLIIWLDIKTCGAHTTNIFQNNRDRLYHINQKLNNSIVTNNLYGETIDYLNQMDQTELKDYIISLFNMNNNPKGPELYPPDDPLTDIDESLVPIDTSPSGVPKSNIFRLYLLNQEHIEGNRYNIELKFSDHAELKTYSSNNSTKYLLPNQIKAVENDGIIHLLPTTAASGYSDMEHQLYHHIIKTNNFELTNNRFIKYNNIPIFREAENNINNGSTIFSLGMAIVGETDEMKVLDRISNQDTHINIKKTEISPQSSILENSLCCWHLILHIADDTFGFMPYDSLGNIDYGNYDPKIPGYSFISNFKDKKYLIPSINLNAPNNFIYGTSTAAQCVYGKEALNNRTTMPPPFDILPIIIVFPAGSLVEAVMQTESVNAQGETISTAIVNFLGDLRRYEQSQIYNRALYIPKYDRFPHGDAGKVLLNVSKDNHIWYKLEASIFKYLNSQTMMRNKYQYIKLHKDISSKLSNFSYNIVSSMDDLIDQNLVSEIYISIDIQEPIQNSLDIKKLKEELENLIEERKTLIDSYKNSTPTEMAQKRLQFLNQQIEAYNLTISNIPVDGFERYSLIRLVGQEQTPTPTTAETTESDEDTESENGIYYLDLDDENNKNLLLNKIDVLDTDITFDKVLTLLSLNSLLGTKFKIIEKKTNSGLKYTEINENKLIKINGLRAYHFFNIDDKVLTQISISEEIEKQRILGNKFEVDRLTKLLSKQQYIDIENTIKSKNYIFKNNQHYTILALEESVSSGGVINKTRENCDIVLLFKTDHLTLDGNTINSYNKWPFVINNDDILTRNTPYLENTTIGENSYGTGSVMVNPKILFKTFTRNKFKDLNQRINSRQTDRFTTVNMQIFDDKATKKKESIASIIGFSYSQEDFEYIFSEYPISFMGNGSTNKETEELLDFLSQLMKNIKHHVITQNKIEPVFIDVKSEIFKDQEIPDFGEIIINEDLNFITPTYKFSQKEIDQLQTRLDFLNSKETLTEQIESNCTDRDSNCIDTFLRSQNFQTLNIADLDIVVNGLNDDPIECSTRDGFTENLCKKILARNIYNRRIQEIQNIIYYIEYGGGYIPSLAQTATPTTSSANNGQSAQASPTPTPTVTSTQSKYKAYDGDKVLPYFNIDIKVDENDGGSITFSEVLNNDDYWINIDPEQGCSLAKDACTKILLKATYKCQRVNNQVTRNASHICGNSSPVINIDDPGADMWVNNLKGDYEYKTPKYKILSEINKYPNLKWSYNEEDESYDDNDTYIVERQFFLNMLGDEKNQLVDVVEIYLLPKEDKSKNTTPDGNATNKVKNIFNLDDTNQLYVKFRNIPRKLKDSDQHYDRYVPNKYGELTKSLIPAKGGPNNTNFAIWKCINKNTGRFNDPPDYYKWQNEMIFRAFFGGVDGAEHVGNSYSQTKSAADWIPYDYSR